MNRMIRPFLFAALVAVSSVDACAQPRYTPSRPAISPWLNLTGRSGNFGGLPNYYRWVRPQQEQNRFQTFTVQSLSAVNEISTTGATGSASVFNNWSHYYATQRTSLRRR